ncbi:MAG: uroporphyrin-III C-methyltransferase/precorrin-2 dehydrogenase/sirohydrochlorin ferrochelatase [Oleiphilaceae bacterium]|jgi:uroporphyrin-III C-methyltransferase/precorrin-2 dehydrogenase/sirohydrochlorin ferrochelatase
MDFLPLFFDLKKSSAIVFGDTPAAARKIEVLLRAKCQCFSIATTVNDTALLKLQENSLFSHVDLASDELWDKALLVVAATGDAELDEQIAKDAKQRKLPVNVVNRADLSSFIFPSIIDRSPLIAAVSSSGELPILTRLMRSRLESSIPHAFGRLATIASEYRNQVKASLKGINERRRFWEKHLEGHFADLIFSGREQEAEELLKSAISSIDSGEITNDGEVYLVGAGPGDPDLLTFKALRLIRQADIVLYDRLVSEPILKLVRQDAEMINVGKERSNHLVPQESINDLLVRYAKSGKRVLRLKGGDPFIFGRGGEEIESLAEEGINFQVVPGITAASGCAAYSGIPLTHRDYSQSVRFITGHLKNNTCDLPWSEFVRPNQTLVFYMGLIGLPLITKSLIDHGMSSSTPIALISKGTTRDQRVITGTLESIVSLVDAAKLPAPTLIIIGEVVNLREKLNWKSEV